MIEAARRFVERRTETGFADGQIVAYPNRLDREHWVVYTTGGQFDDYRVVASSATAYNP
ncbi:hypothetical protein [Halobaculum sp. MBLA0143]|uniref:hypothetical protein n=1 Tax=Halobaculum sp. MBLA0143 TaxID=3079933 RepID=UPI0035248E4D